MLQMMNFHTFHTYINAYKMAQQRNLTNYVFKTILNENRL